MNKLRHLSRNFRRELCGQTDIDCLKIVLAVEKLLGIHRAIHLNGLCTKIVSYFHLIVGYAFVVGEIYRILYAWPKPYYSAYYHVLATVFDGFFFATAIVKSQNFCGLLSVLNKNHEAFSNNTVYAQNLIKIKRKVKYLTVYNFVYKFCVLFLIIIPLYHFKQPLTAYFMNVTLDVNYALSGCRFHIEFTVFYCILKIISEQLHCVIRSISGTTELLNLMEGNFHTNLELSVFVEQWNEYFSKILKAVDLFESVFSFVFSAMTAGNFFFYIIIMQYNVIEEISTTVLKLVAFTLSTIMFFTLCLQVAQNIQHDGQRLRVCLARLLNSISCDSNYEEATKQLIRDLLRKVANSPLYVEASGFTIDKGLLPSTIMLFTSYAVVILQFNNII